MDLAFSTCARGCVIGFSDPFSTRMDEMPYRLSKTDANIPQGPPPTINTSVLFLLAAFVAAARAIGIVISTYSSLCLVKLADFSSPRVKPLLLYDESAFLSQTSGRVKANKPFCQTRVTSRLKAVTTVTNGLCSNLPGSNSSLLF